MDNKINLDEESVNFWIPHNAINFNDSRNYKLFAHSSSEGGILIVKDSEKKLKAVYVKIGVGKKEVSVDVSSLEKENRHMVTLTWKEGSINLYLNGTLSDSTN